MPNAYTFTLTDSGDLISAAQEAQITACAQYVIGLVSRYIEWQGTLDFVVDIKPASASPYPEVNGILPSVAQIGWNGSAWVNETLNECLTGVDTNPASPDAGCTIYLADDGTIRNYGFPVWFDPNPQFGVDPGVPAGMHDFIGIYTHEVFHALGFYQVTQQWQNKISTHDGLSWFDGGNVMDLFGGSLPFEIGRDHYGYVANPSIPISRGLMFQYGNYERNRLDIGRIDLAVLEDLGHTIKSYDGLPLFELLDYQLNLTGTSGAERLYGDYHANILSGLGGNDLLDGGAGDDRLDGGGGIDDMSGGAGDDLYFVDDAADSARELAGEGRDIVYASVNYALHAGTHIELLSAASLGGTDPLQLSGNERNNEIYGNAGANVLRGGGGSDLLLGGFGDDIYYLTSGGETIFEYGSEGRDVIYTGLSHGLAAGSHVEILSAISLSATDPLQLSGNELNQEIYGNAGANVLRGGGGSDLLLGGFGDDQYYITSGGETIFEYGNEGRDVIYTSLSHNLAAGSHVEILSAISLSSTDNINLGGNALDNYLYGNAGSNILYGGGGLDTLIGGFGDDIYYIIGGNEIVSEGAGQGRDIVYVNFSYTLAAGVQAEILSAASIGAADAIDLIGNEFAQEVDGNNGANTIDGKGGSDLLVGYGGADSFAFTTALGAGNVDYIADFANGVDRIALDDAVFAGLGLGALAAGAFALGAAAADADDRIVYDSATGRLFFDADGNGAGAAVQFATVASAPALAASDFMVI